MNTSCDIVYSTMESIHAFTSLYIALFRPNKRTYYIFKWDEPTRKWYAHLEDLPGLSLHRSNHGNAAAELHLQVRRTSAVVDCSADGHFLRSGDKIMTVLRKVRGTIPIVRDYTAVQNDTYEEDHQLWSIKEVIADTSVPKIPRRIAWIIAEDAAKQNEICPISMETISPLTSSVTSCFHVFYTESIREWFETKAACPVCRKACSFTEAFEDEAPPLSTVE